MAVGAGEHALTYPPAVDLRNGSAPASSGGPYVIDTLVLFNNTLVPGNFLAANGIGPSGTAYDSGKGEIFVANLGSNTASVISDATNKVVATIPVGSYPIGTAYDSGKGEVFVTNVDSNTVSVISEATNTVVATVAVGSDPFGVAYDSGKGEIFVANAGSDNVSVVSDATNTMVATVAVGSEPFGAAYDSGKGEVFVANLLSNTVSVISDATKPVTVVATVAVGSYPIGAAYDSGKGEVFVTNVDSNTVSVISDATNTVVATVAVGSGPYGAAYDGGTNEVFIANGFGSNSVSVISDATNTVVATVPVGSSPAGVAYDSANGYIYVSNYGQGTISIISAGAAWYAVTFIEIGLLSGKSWSATLNGTPESSRSTLITFTEPNGTYAFTVGSVAGYTVSPSLGSVTVNRADVTEAVTFTQVTYTVTFTEGGLPSGTTWSVNLNGVSESSNTVSIAYTEPNGTFSYSVGAVAGYAASPSSGTVTVAGSPVTQAITFTALPPPTYALRFTESGLSTGTKWSVTCNGTTESSATRSSTGSSIVFIEPNGTYSFTVGSVPGYTVNPSTGTVTVNGLPVSQSIAFKSSSTTPSNGTGSATFLGLPAAGGYALLGGIVAVVIVAAVVTVLLRGRRKTPPSVVTSPSAPGAGGPPAPP